MRLIERLIVSAAAALCLAWLRSSLRQRVRAVIRWRTAYLLEQIDADATALRELRDRQIPRGFRVLAERKRELIDQWTRFSDGGEPVPVPLPDPAPAARTGWSPNHGVRVGPLFQQRNHKQ